MFIKDKQKWKPLHERIMDELIYGKLEPIKSATERIFFVQGMSTEVNSCNTLECFLYRYNICKNQNYRHCFPYPYYLENIENIREEQYNIFLEKRMPKRVW